MNWLRHRLVWPIKSYVFKILRPLVVPDCHVNEDYVCVTCGAPVLRRFLTCSDRCRNMFFSLGKSAP